MMISYAFDQRTVPLIQAGVVCATFRAPSLRHARPGERIRLTDRETFAAIIPDPVCHAVERCEIAWHGNRISTIREAGLPVVNHRQFAKGLGYASVEDLEADLAKIFGASFIEGFLITWIAPTPAEMEAAA